MRRILTLSIFEIYLLICFGCAPRADPIPHVTTNPILLTSSPTDTLQPTIKPANIATLPATLTPDLVKPSATIVAQSTQTQIPDFSVICPVGQTACILDGHFLMHSPIGPSGNASVDATYLYGSTQDSTREPHHGVDIPNVFGTPVLASAEGTVVFAGNDKNVILAWVTSFYGNVVVLEHHFPEYPQPIFTLYGHLSFINVNVGQEVHQGDVIGKVGATGRAIGSHLHFEVRFGQNSYLSNRNPELWLLPVPGTGVIIGRIQTLSGEAVAGIVNVQRINNGVLNPQSVVGLETYVTKEFQPVNGDDVWHENFASGELPAGQYRLSIVFHGGIREQVVTIEPGKLVFVRFIL